MSPAQARVLKYGSRLRLRLRRGRRLRLTRDKCFLTACGRVKSGLKPAVKNRAAHGSEDCAARRVKTKAGALGMAGQAPICRGTGEPLELKGQGALENILYQLDGYADDGKAAGADGCGNIDRHESCGGSGVSPESIDILSVRTGEFPVEIVLFGGGC